MSLITSAPEAAAFCRRLAAEEFVTIDTEFMRERTFWPQLCLVQLAGADEAHAIDPLAPGMDLTPLHALLAEPGVLKVMHAARQDIEIFVYLDGRVPTPLFDTQIAAMVCGFGDQVGYETLVSRLTGHRPDKSSRFTDWSARPLSPRQLSYALGDVTHLRAAYLALRDRIGDSGRMAWLAEELEALVAPAAYVPDPETAWQRLRLRSRNAEYLAVLRAAAAWREREAMRRDVPRSRVLRDETLGQIAAHPPRDGDELDRLRGASHGFGRSRAGVALLEAVAAALALPPEAAPQPPDREPVRGPQAVADLLRVLLRARCEEHHVAEKLVAAGDDLQRIAAGVAGDDVPALRGWRRELFGADALRLHSGEVALATDGDRVALVPVADGTAARPDRTADGGATGSGATGSGATGGRRRRRRRRRGAGPRAGTAAESGERAGDA